MDNKNVFMTFLLFQLIFFNYSLCQDCPRDKPILKDNECQMVYCSPEEFENNTCTISNYYQKVQWINNFHLFGIRYITHICPISNSKGELFLLAQSLMFGDGHKYLFGFSENGDGLFYDETYHCHYSFSPIDFQSRTYPETFRYVEYNNKGFLLSTSYESNMYLIDYTNKTYSELRDNLLSQYSDTIFKLNNYEQETYFTDFIYCDKQYNFNECWLNLRIFRFDLTKIQIILDIPEKINILYKNKIHCFQIEGNYIQCLYTTEEKINELKVYNRMLSLFNSKNLNLLYNETIENNIDTYCSFDNVIQLKENVFVIGYSSPNNQNAIKLMLKKLVIDNNNFYYDNYINSLEYININEDNYYLIQNSTAKRNYMVKISENKFSLLINEFKDETKFTYGNKKLIILICTIYNKETNIIIRYYTINFGLYGRKLIDDLKGYYLNDYFGVLLETDINNANQAVFMTFGYVNATHNESKIDEKLQLNNTDSIIRFSDYITGIENNLFGYDFLGIKIIEIPPEKDSGYFVNNINGKKIEKSEMVDLNTIIRFILSNDYRQGKYFIAFVGLVSEPNYETMNNFAEKIENYPINDPESQKDYYNPKILTGKTVNYTFLISCYDSCFTCISNSIDPQEQKCIECKPNFYFQYNTTNCFSEIEGYYLDKDSKIFFPCYPNCKTCSKKEESSTKMNCDSCIQGYKHYTRSSNCLKCPKFVNYEQTDCIDEVPEGYFVDNEYMGTLGKCHEYCKTCDDYPSYWGMNCLECKYYNPKFVPLYDGDCPSDDYYDYEEEDYEEEEYLGGECPRDKPILKKLKDCSDEYCSEYDFKDKTCIIANLIIKEQWLNNFHNFGAIDISFASAEIGEKDEIFLFAQSQQKGNKEKYLFAFNSNGEGLFYNESNKLNYSFKKLPFTYDEYVDSVKYVKDYNNQGEYLLSTQFGEKMYLFNFTQENPVSKDFTFDSYAYSTDTIFQIDDDTYTYFTDFVNCEYDDPSDDCYINLRKFIIEKNDIKIIKEVIGNITVSSKNHLTCLFSEFDYVQCTYTTQEKVNSKYIYNHVIGFYDEETFEYVDSYILKDNFYTDAFFDSMISLKEEENVFVIAYSISENIITVLLKKIGYNVDYSEIVMGDYIKEIPYINLNEDNLYIFRGSKSDRNSLYRIDDDKFAIFVNNFKNSAYYSSSQANGIVIFIFTIYNNNQNINVRHYTINFKMYNTFVEGDIRPFMINGFLGILIELTSPLQRSLSRSSFFTFGYINSTSVGLDKNFIQKGSFESKILKINEYINDIENNLFGYEFLGVKILELPEENKAGYFVNVTNNFKINVNDIINIDTQLKFIVKQNAEENIYHIIFAGIVKEPDYNTMNKFAEKVESYPSNNVVSEGEFYIPKFIMGKKVDYSFNIGEVKYCYKNCKECRESSINEEDQKCLECINNFYFKEGTNNCYNRENTPSHYYFNEDIQKFSPCYKNCLSCSNKEINSTHMNCITCENNLNYYDKSTNCLKCEKYINYLQTECINTIPDGYFLFDAKLGIIEKCHDLCETCNKKSELIDGNIHMNCLTCLYNNKNYKPKFEGNCPESEDNNGNNKEHNYSSNEKVVLIWVVIIGILIICLVTGFIIYKKYRYKNIRNENDYSDFKGQNISMEDESGIN